MNHPAEDKILRERLDRLADSVSGGDGIDGGQLYRRGLKRRRRRIAATAGLVAVGVVAAGAAFGSAVQPGTSPEIGPATVPASPTSGVCELPDRLAEAVEVGAMTEEEACQTARLFDEAIEARQGPRDFPGGPSLVIEGTVNQEWVTQCRTGSFPIGEGYEDAELYCNAILKIAAGELEPTGTCDPPACSEPGTLLWEYSEAQLRDLAK